MSHAPPARSGSVLIVVLWACLGLVTICLHVGHRMAFALRAADNTLAGRQAEQAIEGAIRYAGLLLAQAETPGLLPEEYEAEDVPVGDARLWLLARPASTYTGSEPVYGLQDEAAKLNLNTATLEMLEALPGMTVELAAAIVDWRDADDDITEYGAESETYLLGSPAYECKNAPFETVEELRLVAGATRDILYGDDWNRNGVQDPDETAGAGRFDPGILAYLTVYTREPNQRADGSARLQVSPPAEDLEAVLTEALGEERGREVLQALSGGGQGQQSQSMADVYLRSGMTADEFDLVAGEMTVTEDPFLPGLVNVNTAPEEVLATLPGITAELAASLVAERSTHAAWRPSIGWAVDVLGREAAAEAGPYLTAGTWQVAVDAAAVGRHGRGFRRTRAVVDVAEGSPRIVYRQDLGGLGWALGADLFETLHSRGGNR